MPRGKSDFGFRWNAQSDAHRHEKRLGYLLCEDPAGGGGGLKSPLGQAIVSGVKNVKTEEERYASCVDAPGSR